MNDFYTEYKEQSFIKTTLVKKYFSAWAIIMNRQSRSDRLGYIDLFCGPGIYKDGSHSTPIEVLNIILSNEEFMEKFVVYFNDKEQCYIDSLKNEIIKLDKINELKHKPILSCSEVDNTTCEEFERISMIPSFVFIDPWGYKGVSKKLIQALTKDWGCDCVLFFNYNRINSGITNPKVENHMRGLFGKKRYTELNKKLALRPSISREDIIINEFSEVMRDCGIEFVLPFRFLSTDRNATSHYIIFLTKNKTGYKIMKEIMANESTNHGNEIGTFQYIPVSNHQLSFLDQFEYSFPKLKDELLELYAGKSLKVIDIYHSHNVNTPYILKNYKTVLLELEEENKIKAYKPNRRKGFMADDVIITFPK